jgi:hypothetical protein
MIEREVTLDLSEPSRQLAELLSDLNPKPSMVEVQQFLNLAFFASLEREEGAPIRFALALVDHEMFAGAANPQYWRALAFVQQQAATVAAVAKVASAVDRYQTHIAIGCREGTLQILGLIRTGRAYHRFSLGEVDSAAGAGCRPLVARVNDAGVVEVDVGTGRFMTIARGAILSSAVNVFDGGRIFDVTARWATQSGLTPEIYQKLLRQAIQRLSVRGHGGTILLTEGESWSNVDFRYRLAVPSDALRDVARVYSGERLGATAESEVSVVGNSPSREQLERARLARRAVEQHEFMRDGADFAADLASVDGALVLDTGLRIVGFGAHLLFSDPQDVPVKRAPAADATNASDFTLKGFGTRHNSAARYCYNVPGAMAFVVSQDGAISCLFRASAHSPLIIWRPVSLQTAFPVWKSPA